MLAAIIAVAVACTGSDHGRAAPDDEQEPQYGGRLIYGIEADTANPWMPSQAACATSCSQVFRAVFDPIAEVDEAGDVRPVLAETIDHNDDYSVWTVRVRSGITFHDGTPLDAEALVDAMQHLQSSPFASAGLADVDDVDALDGRTVEYRLRRPWVAFERTFVNYGGFIPSPTWVAAVEAGRAEPDEPVGTGAFVFESYEPGGSFVAVRNDDYWRTDAAGRQLPYLDAIEFKVVDQEQTRVTALESGEIDVMHTANGSTIRRLREDAEDGETDLIEDPRNAETIYLMFNNQAPDSPVTDLRVRRAVAHAIDAEVVNEARFDGVFTVANGPYPPDAPGHLTDTGFPTYDAAEARRLVDEYERDAGPIEFGLTTTSDDTNLLTAQLLQEMLREVGIDVHLDRVEQGQFILQAGLGQFEALTFRNLATLDPDGNHGFWGSETSNPVGTFGLNFGRIEDEVIDESFETIRTNPDPEIRREASEAINRRFAEQVYDVWLAWGRWAVASDPAVHQIATGYNLPDGGENRGMTGAAHQLSQIWIEQ